MRSKRGRMRACLSAPGWCHLRLLLSVRQGPARCCCPAPSLPLPSTWRLPPAYHAARCVDLPLVGRQCTGDNPLYAACAALAQGYFEAVDTLGAESFERDQADQAAHVQACQAGAAGGGGDSGSG